MRRASRAPANRSLRPMFTQCTGQFCFHRKPNLIKTVFGSDPEFENGILSVSFHDFDCTVIYTES
jgi:hypothetical protein